MEKKDKLILNEEIFVQKMIEAQSALHRIDSQIEFENNFISSVNRDIINRLRGDKEFLKTYYLKLFSIKRQLTHKDKSQLPSEKEKTPIFSFFKRKTKDTESNNTNKFNFTLKECTSVEKYEQALPSIDLASTFTSNGTEDHINIIAFSVIPSYFNFFLTESDINNFISFLTQINELNVNKIFFESYSSIIYHTPLFLNFCHHVIFNSVIIDCIHNPDKISFYKLKENFYQTIIESIETNHHFCPPLLKKFLEAFSNIQDFSLSDHIKNHFLYPLFECPLQFSVIREFDYLPEDFFDEIKYNDDTQNDDNQTNYIDQLINKIIQIPLNPKLFINEKNGKPVRIFTSFDISIINDIDSLFSIDFSNYSFYYVCKNQDEIEPKSIPDDIIKIFKELLRLADPLPNKIKPPKNKDDVFKIMERYLVENGDFNTQVERTIYFNKLKKYIEDGNSLSLFNDIDFLNTESLDSNRDILNEMARNEKDMNTISMIIKVQINHINNVYKLFNSAVFNDKNIIPYTKSEIKKIVKNPQQILDDYSQYLKKSDIKKLSEFDKKIYYFKKLSDLRFSDFTQAYGSLLAEYDSLTSNFIKCNHDKIINDILGRKQENKLTDLVNVNSYLLLPFIDDFNRIFEENGSPFEKCEDMSRVVAKINNFDNEPDSVATIFQIIILKTRCNHLLSNIAFIENFYFKILPSNDVFNKIQNLSLLLTYIYPMGDEFFYSSIVPFTAKTIDGLFLTYGSETKEKKERLFFTSSSTYKTYVVILNYSNSYANLDSYNLVVALGKKSASAIKRANNDIKIAICNNGETPDELKQISSSICVVESINDCFAEMENQIFQKYDMPPI